MSGECAVIDNACNDDPGGCDDDENEWIACICRSNGDAAEAADCDEAFMGAHASAPDIIACAHDNCAVCYETDPDPCAIATYACQECYLGACGDEVGACGDDAGCGPGVEDYGACGCSAQRGEGGTIEACDADLVEAGGELAEAALGCLRANCGDACGL